jgi:NADH-quinone oxidoreductase subunit C
VTVNWNRQNFTAGEPEKHPAVQAIRRSFPSAILEVDSSCDEVWIVISPIQLIEVLTFLRDEQAIQYDFLSDVTAIHWPHREGAEFEVVYQLYSIPNRMRFRVKVNLAEGEEIKSSCSVWRAADWLEREVYDMFGIHFIDHPDPRRILNPDAFEGYPLRKDFPLAGRVRW